MGLWFFFDGRFGKFSVGMLSVARVFLELGLSGSTIQQNHISYVYVYSKILNAIPNAKLELDSVYFSIMRKLIK